jgi:hypothetical protein
MNYTEKLLEEMNRRATSIAPENKTFLLKLLKNPPRNLDSIVHRIHLETFSRVDCLQCGNCCKTIGPMLFESDIARLATAQKLKLSAFKDTYIKMDEDGDYVFKEKPCPFLCADNICQVYENRPKACREYPHTDRKRFYQVSLKTYHSTFICPAAYSIVEDLKKKLK